MPQTPGWTAAEVETLKRMMDQGATMAAISEVLEKAEGAVRGKASREWGATRQTAWTAKEEALVRDLWPRRDMPTEAIAAMLPGRSVGSVCGKAARLNLPPKPRDESVKRKPSTPPPAPRLVMGAREEARIRELWSLDLSLKQIGNELGVSKEAVRRRAKMLNLRPRSSFNKWTPEQDATLERLWPDLNHSVEAIAEACGHTVSVTKLRRAALKLPPRASGNRLTDAQADEVRQLHAQGLDRGQIKAKTGRALATIDRILGTKATPRKAAPVEQQEPEQWRPSPPPPFVPTPPTGCLWITDLSGPGVQYCGDEKDGPHFCTKHRAYALDPITEDNEFPHRASVGEEAPPAGNFPAQVTLAGGVL